MQTITLNGKKYEIVSECEVWTIIKDEEGKTFALRKKRQRTHQEAIKILKRDGFPEEHIEILQKLKQTTAIKHANTYLEKLYPSKWAYFQGTTGSGKTTAAVYITYKLLLQGDINGAFYKAGYQKTETLQEKLQDFKESILVVIDDLGMQPDFKQKDDISEILFTAYDKKKPVIITSNYNWKDIAELYGDQRLISRFRQKIVLFECGTKDLRTIKLA